MTIVDITAIVSEASIAHRHAKALHLNLRGRNWDGKPQTGEQIILIPKDFDGAGPSEEEQTLALAERLHQDLDLFISRQRARVAGLAFAEAGAPVGGAGLDSGG